MKFPFLNSTCHPPPATPTCREDFYSELQLATHKLIVSSEPFFLCSMIVIVRTHAYAYLFFALERARM